MGYQPTSEQRTAEPAGAFGRPRAAEARDVSSFLVDAGGVLERTGHPDAALASVTQLAVPRAAEAAAVWLLAGDGALRRLPGCSATPLLFDRLERIAAGTRGGSALEQVIATGETRRFADAFGDDPGHSETLIVPLCHDGTVRGALAFVAALPAWSELDVALLRDLGTRIGTLLDHVRVSAEARAAAQQFREAVDGLDVVVWELDPERDRYTFVNRRAAEVLGFPPERWLAQSGFRAMLVHGDDLARVQAAAQAALEDARGYDLEYRVRTAAGRVRWVRDVATASRDSLGTPRLRGVMIDVTERRMTEQRIEMEHAVTRALAMSPTFPEATEGALAAIATALGWTVATLWTLDPVRDRLVMTSTWHTPAARAGELEAHGRTLAFARGQGLPGRVWASGAATWMPDVTRDLQFGRAMLTARAGLHAGLAFPVRVEDAVLGVVELFAPEAPETDPELLHTLEALGAQLGLHLARRRAADAVIASEARKTAVLESAPDAVLTLEGEGRIVELNPAAERMFGERREALVGRALAALLVPDEGHGAGAESGATRPGEHVALRHDGTRFPVELTVTRIAGQEPPRFVATLRDVTRRQLQQEEIRRLTDTLERRVAERTGELESANRELESFAWSVSHDLRAPLRHIRGFAEMLVEDHPGLDADTRRTLSSIRETAERGGRVIEDLLSLARHARAPLDRRPVDMQALVGRVIDLLSPETRAHPVQWVVRTLPEASGDEGKLGIVLENLLSNAVKYSRPRPEPRIEIGGRAEDAELVYWVRDNGVGFDPRHAHRLFTAFERLHGPTEFEGTGVGLAIVRRIVLRHGGRVWGEGAPDRGATFYFSLPRRQEPEPEPRAPQA